MRVASNWLCMYIQIKNDIWCPPHWRSPSEGCCSRLLISIRMLESQWVRQIVGGYGFCKIAGSTESCGPLSALFAALMDGEILVKRGGASSSGSCTSRYLNAGIFDVSTVIFILPLIGYDTPLHSCSSATSTKLRLQFPRLYRQLQLKSANVSNQLFMSTKRN